MISESVIEVYGLIVVCFLLTLILLRILFYVRKQANQVRELRREMDLLNKARTKVRSKAK